MPLIVSAALVAGGVSAVVWSTQPATAATPAAAPKVLPPLASDTHFPLQSGKQGRGVQPVTQAQPPIVSSESPQDSVPPVPAITGYSAATSTVVSRTATENLFQNADGTQTAQISSADVNYQASSGSWLPIDNSLANDPDRAGGYTNAANSWRAHFGTATQGYSVDTAAGSLSMTGVGVTSVAPQPTLTGDGVLYPGAWPHADLKYTITSDAVKESILLNSRAAASSYLFLTRSGTKASTLSGLASQVSLTPGAAGSLIPPGALGSAITVEPAVVVNAAGDVIPAAGATLTTVGGLVKVSIDPTWLAAQPDSTFPINVDPTVHIGTDVTYAYRSDGYSCSSCSAQVGNSISSGNTYWRGIVHYPLSSLAGTQILGTSVSVYTTSGTTNAYVLKMYHATAFSWAGAGGTGTMLAAGNPGASGTISGSGLTVYLQSQADAGANDAYFGYIGDETAGTYTYQAIVTTLFVTVNHKPTVATPVSPSPANNGSYHLLSYTLKASSTDADSDPLQYYFRVALGSDAESNVLYNSGWQSSNQTTFTTTAALWNTKMYWHVYVKDPYWATNPDYVYSFTPVNSAPASPAQSGALPTDQAVVATTTPTLSVPAATDPNGDTVYYDFTIAGGGDLPAGRASSGWQAATTWTVPTGVLDDGQSYQWNVTTSDGPLNSPWTVTASSWSNIVTINQRLGSSGPVPTDSLAGVTVNLANGNAVVGVSGHSMNTVAGQIGVGLTYNSQAATRNGLVGQYYPEKDRNWTVDSGETPSLVRIDPSLDLRWNQGTYPASPPGLPVAQFLIHWTGYITLPGGMASGSYQLGVESDNGSRIYWDTARTKIFDNWGQGAAPSTPAWATAQTMTPGIAVPIEIDYYNAGGPGQFSLFVQGSGVNQQIVPSDWLSSSIASLPTGWALSLPGGAAGYTRAATGNGVVVLTDGAGASHTYRANGSGGYTPPAGEDATLTQDTSGLLTLQDSDGSTYTFDAHGNPTTASTAADSLHPAAANYTYDASVVPPRVTMITDPVSMRTIALYYGGDAHCPTASGYDSPPAPNLLCRVAYWDGTNTDLLYTNGQLSSVIEPGNEITQFGYSGGLLTAIASPLFNDWRNADWTDRASAPGFTSIAYTWVAPGASGSTNIRPSFVPVSIPYPVGSVPLVTSVTAPSPDGTSSSPIIPQHTYTYVGNDETQVHIAGLATAADRDVTYDATGRPLTTTSATGQSTSTSWNADDTPSSITDAAGRKSTTIYDWAHRATDSYGPAPATCFQNSGLPVASPPATCGQIPHTHTGYDTDVHGTRLTGLQATHWTNTSLSAAPAQRITAGPKSASWTTAQNAVLSSVGSTRFTGEVALAPGTYTFSAAVGDKANDGVRVYVDDQPVLDRWWTLRQAILADTPAGYWRLSDATGSSTASNQISTGTAGSASAVTFGSAGAGPVDPSTAGLFNGSTSQISVPDSSSLDQPSALSIEAWIKPTASSTTRMIVTKDTGTGATNNNYELRLDTAGHLQFLQADGTTYYTATSTTVMTSGAWHHVAVTKTPNGAIALYIDGIADATTASFPATVPTNSQPMLIGRRADGYSFNGSIADVAVYSYALSTIQVATHHTAGTATLSGTVPVTFTSPAPVATGSLPAAPASTPHRVQIEYRDPVTAASIVVNATPSGGSAAPIPDTAFDTRLGLATYSVKNDAGGVTGGTETIATSFSGNGLDPVYGLSTDQVIDPNGLNLDTALTYETPGSGYLREIAKTLPSANGSVAGESRTIAYYGDSEIRDIPCSGAATGVNQGGLIKVITDPSPASGPATGSETVYDQEGRVAATRSINDGSNWTCTSYDARGRIAQVNIPALNGALARTVTYNYAVGGNPLVESVADSSGTITTTVDLLGRNVSYTDATGTTTTTQYDQAGRPYSTMIAASGGGATSTLTRSFLDDGRVSSVSLDGNVVANEVYDTNAELAGVSYPTGSGDSGNGASMSSITRNPQGRLTSQSWNLPGSHVITDSQTLSQASRTTRDTLTQDGTTSSDWTYTYDAAGRITNAVLAASGSRPQVSYGYAYAASGGCGLDPNAGQDSARTSQTVTLGAGSPQTTNSCTDYASRLTSATGAHPLDPNTIAYDDHGNAIQIGNQTFVYDASDRLAASTVTTGATTQSFTYTHDVADRLLARSATGTGTGTISNTSTYAYADASDSPALQLTESNQIGERYISLPGGALLTKRYAFGGGDIWSLPNIHGDTIVTTNSSGVSSGPAVIYDPYGTPIDPSTGLANPADSPTTRTNGLNDAWEGSHQRGYESAAGSNMILMGARLYLPAWGIFTSPDPISGGNSNPYIYPSDPINMDDLTGQKHHCWWCDTIQVVGAVAAVTAVVASGGTVLIVASAISIAASGAMMAHDCKHGINTSCALDGAGVLGGGLAARAAAEAASAARAADSGFAALQSLRSSGMIGPRQIANVARPLSSLWAAKAVYAIGTSAVSNVISAWSVGGEGVGLAEHVQSLMQQHGW